MTVAVTRLELRAGDLRREAKRCRDGAAARRMPALALVLEGHAREEAARHAGMDRQTLRDWVHRYHAQGLAGLHDRPHPGPKPRLTAGQMTELGALVEQGPDPERDGIVRWRRVDLQAVIERRLGVNLHERLSAAPASRRGIGQGRWPARCCAGLAWPVCRCAPSTPPAIPRRRPHSKKLL